MAFALGNLALDSKFAVSQVVDVSELWCAQMRESDYELIARPVEERVRAGVDPQLARLTAAAGLQAASGPYCTDTHKKISAQHRLCSALPISLFCTTDSVTSLCQDQLVLFWCRFSAVFSVLCFCSIVHVSSAQPQGQP